MEKKGEDGENKYKQYKKLFEKANSKIMLT